MSQSASPQHTARTIQVRGLTGTPVTFTAECLPGASSLALLDADWPHQRDTADRVLAAMRNAGLPVPATYRIHIRIAPPHADVTPAADLALAALVLAVVDEMPADPLASTTLIGELALDGTVRPTRGVLPAVRAARDYGVSRVIVPTANLAEAALAGVDVLGVPTLADLAAWLRGQAPLTRPALAPGGRDPAGESSNTAVSAPVLSPQAWRAVEIAAAGRHHVLALAAPGADALLLAERLHTLLPALSLQQQEEVTAVHSLAGTLLADVPLITAPPVQYPDHSTSMAGLIAGIHPPRPGAVCLAHHGLVVLDDLPKFGAQRLGALRTVLADGKVQLAAGDGVTTYPAQAQLYATSRLCPCGPVPNTPCTCTGWTVVATSVVPAPRC